MVIIDKKEIIKVAADILGRPHRGIQSKLVPVGIFKVPGQHPFLNQSSNAKLGLNSLSLRGDCRQLINITDNVTGHFVKGFGQNFDFIPSFNIDIQGHDLT